MSVTMGFGVTMQARACLVMNRAFSVQRVTQSEIAMGVSRDHFCRRKIDVKGFVRTTSSQILSRTVVRNALRSALDALAPGRATAWCVIMSC